MASLLRVPKEASLQEKIWYCLRHDVLLELTPALTYVSSEFMSLHIRAVEMRFAVNRVQKMNMSHKEEVPGPSIDNKIREMRHRDLKGIFSHDHRTPIREEAPHGTEEEILHMDAWAKIAVIVTFYRLCEEVKSTRALLPPVETTDWRRGWVLQRWSALYSKSLIELRATVLSQVAADVDGFLQDFLKQSLGRTESLDKFLLNCIFVGDVEEIAAGVDWKAFGHYVDPPGALKRVPQRKK